ncbi:uncharacterized protein PSFLO_07755 [Pseudozyma flocculosa]|uniref:Uncharacterized protein n=1 Tax=Pseudozyma flocculosa TaxID=84751 RepID=A0A5C3FCY2_9BASI|nr:uncharacterized protein PSFLO_07719 [Pseudozyma flocculosa]SPO42272.1 uncharacterized protein PSFLO_07755 [Pseudozyma flocculosa]
MLLVAWPSLAILGLDAALPLLAWSSAALPLLAWSSAASPLPCRCLATACLVLPGLAAASLLPDWPSPAILGLAAAVIDTNAG